LRSSDDWKASIGLGLITGTVGFSISVPLYSTFDRTGDFLYISIIINLWIVIGLINSLYILYVLKIDRETQPYFLLLVGIGTSGTIGGITTFYLVWFSSLIGIPVLTDITITIWVIIGWSNFILFLYVSKIKWDLHPYLQFLAVLGILSPIGGLITFHLLRSLLSGGDVILIDISITIWIIIALIMLIDYLIVAKINWKERWSLGVAIFCLITAVIGGIITNFLGLSLAIYILWILIGVIDFLFGLIFWAWIEVQKGRPRISAETLEKADKIARIIAIPFYFGLGICLIIGMLYTWGSDLPIFQDSNFISSIGILFLISFSVFWLKFIISAIIDWLTPKKESLAYSSQEMLIEATRTSSLPTTSQGGPFIISHTHPILAPYKCPKCKKENPKVEFNEDLCVNCFFQKYERHKKIITILNFIFFLPGLILLIAALPIWGIEGIGLIIISIDGIALLLYIIIAIIVYSRAVNRVGRPSMGGIPPNVKPPNPTHCKICNQEKPLKSWWNPVCYDCFSKIIVVKARKRIELMKKLGLSVSLPGMVVFIALACLTSMEILPAVIGTILLAIIGPFLLIFTIVLAVLYIKAENMIIQ